MKITLAQINTVVGDIDGNLERILSHLAPARDAGSDLVVFPEMCISGYPPRDLVERSRFVEDARAALDRVASASRDYPGLGLIVGLPLPSAHDGGKPVANAAVLVADGDILHTQEKSLLPTYDVFDEARYFDPARTIDPVAFKGETLGISICEDAWNDPELYQNRPYEVDPIAVLAKKGASILINVSASPFTVDKEAFRYELIRSHSTRHKLPFVFVNQIGGNDELVFDGRSMFVGSQGQAHAVLPMFEEATVTIDTASTADAVSYATIPVDEATRSALVLGTRDYLGKCGFSRVVVGLSGGIDSALTLAIAVDAVGSANVLAVAMPSPWSSQGSLDDARALAANLGVELSEIEIGPIMQAYDEALSEPFSDRDADVTEENIQARIRGNILMAYSNKFGHIVLSTGNKSELAVGYCTLYGDMSGGLAVISDVPKLMVYRLAELYNASTEVIPRSIIDKAPSAELRPDQKDTDTLPPYETLDVILDLHIEDGLSGDQIVDRGFARDTVEWVLAAVRRNEYKRKQAAPGLKVTSKAFGGGRRFPIAARYRV